MKKSISALLCTAILMTGTIGASAVTTPSDTQTYINQNDFKYSCLIIGEDNIPANTARLYTYGSIDNSYASLKVNFTDNNFKTVEATFNPDVDHVDVKLPQSTIYSTQIYTDTPTFAFFNTAPSFYTKNCEGSYKKLRVRLSDYSDYFNSDGTHTKNNHNYNFTDEGNGYISSLILSSGGAMTAAAPDENGFIEFYFCTKIGVSTQLNTDFIYSSPYDLHAEGGLSADKLKGFMMGDTDRSGAVDIDDVTHIQKCIAEICEFDDLTNITSDIDNNADVTIDDVTALQKYLVQ